MKFDASQLEVERAKHWAAFHGSEAKHPSSRDLEWCFIAAGIGTSVTVRCLGCKQNLNVSDYDSW